jgi:hypothetical protein
VVVKTATASIAARFGASGLLSPGTPAPVAVAATGGRCLHQLAVRIVGRGEQRQSPLPRRGVIGDFGRVECPGNRARPARASLEINGCQV